MKYIDEPIRKYIEEASSGSSTPGGGSIAAMAGALAGSMLNMVCNFTIGKKSYEAVDERVKAILRDGVDLTQRMLSLSVEDTEVYGDVSKAYALPKSTEEEKKKRSQAIQEACMVALQVPSMVIVAGSKILALLTELVDIGNKNLITDTGVAALVSFAAIEAAILNVRINLLFIKDESFVKEKGEWILEIENKCRADKEIVMKKVNKACGV